MKSRQKVNFEIYVLSLALEQRNKDADICLKTEFKTIDFEGVFFL